MPTRWVLLVSDDCFHWTAARGALDAVPAVEVVGEATTLDQGYQLALRLRPDAILTERILNRQAALPVLRRLRPRLPLATFAIIGTGYDAAELLAMEDSGESSFLLWQDLTDGMLGHILAAASGAYTVVFHEAAARAFVAAERQRLAAHEPAPPITDRQRATLHMLAEGLTTAEMAAVLGITERTVKRAIADLEAKFDATDRFMLGMKAARAGLIP